MNRVFSVLKSKSTIKYMISLTIIFALIYHMDASVLLETLKNLNFKAFFLAIILSMGQIVMMNLRWHELMNGGRHNIPFHTNSLINISSFFANILFITSIGGIIAKSALAVRCGLSLMHSVFITCLDRFMTLFALIVLSAIGLPFVDVFDPMMSLMLALSISGVIFSVLISIFLLRSGLFKHYILSSRKRSSFVRIMRSYFENYPMMIRTGGYSILGQSFYILAVFVLSLGLENSDGGLRIIEFITIVPVLALIASLPISIGGWGVREGVFVFGLGLIGFSMENAFFLSVQISFVILIAHCIIVVPYIMKEDLRSFISGKKEFEPVECLS